MTWQALPERVIDHAKAAEDVRVDKYERTTPLHNKILLQYRSEIEVTPGGIVLNTSNIEEQDLKQARVVSVGPGAKAQSTRLKRDDIVLVGKYRGVELPVPVGCEPYVIVDIDWGDEKQGIKNWVGAKVES